MCDPLSVTQSIKIIQNQLKSGIRGPPVPGTDRSDSVRDLEIFLGPGSVRSEISKFCWSGPVLGPGPNRSVRDQSVLVRGSLVSWVGTIRNIVDANIAIPIMNPRTYFFVWFFKMVFSFECGIQVENWYVWRPFNFVCNFTWFNFTCNYSYWLLYSFCSKTFIVWRKIQLPWVVQLHGLRTVPIVHWNKKMGQSTHF